MVKNTLKKLALEFGTTTKLLVERSKMAVFYHTLKSSKQKLNIRAVNKGKINFDKYGRVFDDLEQLHPLVDANSYIHLRSGIEFAMTHYRG